MNLPGKITAIASALAVGGLIALAAPAVASIANAAAETTANVGRLTTAAPEPANEPASHTSADGDGSDPGGCTAYASIKTYSEGASLSRAWLVGELVDRGEREYATGTVITDADGIRAYIVQPNDALMAIGERFCIDYVTVSAYNAVFATIHPGQEVILRPDPTIPFIDPYVPYLAKPGTSTIAYSSAVVDMSSAIVARDIDAARDAWSRLTGDVNPKAVTLASKALDEGDWDVLNSLFP